MDKKTPNLNTNQQEAAYNEYKSENQYVPFWEWYAHWCYENNMVNDRHSYQEDQ